MPDILNHSLCFRPLRGGIYIHSAVLQEPGTLGCVATSDGQDRWLISCNHVLWDTNGNQVADGAAVEQPGGTPVGLVRARRRDEGLDCAAAEIMAGIDCVNEILGLMPVRAPVAAEVGMRVIKSGAATGITEGTILRIVSGTIEIGGPSPGYNISEMGDSGSVWVERDTGALVGLHIGKSLQGRALANPMLDVFAALKLQFLKGQEAIEETESP